MSDHDPYRWGRGKLPQEFEPAEGASQQVENSGGTVIDPASEQTVTSVANLLDAIEDALASVASDSLLVDSNSALGVQSASPLDVSGATVPTEQQTPVAVEDSAGTQVDPATDGTLSSTLSREIASWTAGTLPVQEASPMDVSAATVPTDSQNTDEAFANGATLLANDTVAAASLAASGAERIRGQVTSSGGYDVQAVWQDDAGNTIRTETLATGVTGGNWTDIDVVAKSPYVDIVVADTSGADQTVDATVHVS